MAGFPMTMLPTISSCCEVMKRQSFTLSFEIFLWDGFIIVFLARTAPFHRLE